MVGVVGLVSDVISYLTMDNLEKLELQAAVLDYVADSIFVHDLNGKFLYVNKVAYESRGFTHSELLDMHVKQLDAPDEESYVKMQLRISKMKQQGFVTFETSHQHKDGSIIPVEVRAQVFELNGQKLVISVARDIHDRKEAQAALRKLASTDTLTGLCNRHQFQALYDLQVEKLKIYDSFMSLLLLDIDHFKKINDRFGHNVGDIVIKEMAQCIRSLIRNSDVAGRWGGEEFIVLLPDTTEQNALKIAEKLRERVVATDFTGVEQVTASIGVTNFHQGDTLETFVKRADTALYEAKQSSRNAVRLCKVDKPDLSSD